MFWSLLLLVGAVVAIVWIARGRRPAPPPAAYEPAPVATDWGRQVPPQQTPQPGMGGQVMGGLATGLAIGAGAIAAQEIGRHMLGEHGHQGAGSFDDQHHAGGSGAGSDLARDAGLGSVSLDDTASWDDAGGSFGDGGGGGDS
jgi:uncharacterized protein